MKKPALITVFVTAVFLLFTSCSNLFQALGIENNSGNGSLRVVLPEASPQTGRSAAGASRLAVNTDDIKTYTVTLIKDGAVVAEQTAAAGSSVTFSDIEEGTYTIRGSAYDGRARLAYGSITARVLAGKTTNAAFPMYTTPPIVLWNSNDNDMDFYIADTAARTLYGLPSVKIPSISYVMEFDVARNLYTRDSFLSAASGYNRVRLDDEIELFNLDQRPIKRIYCADDNVLFIARKAIDTDTLNTVYFCDLSSSRNGDGHLVVKTISSAAIKISDDELIAVSRAKFDNTLSPPGYSRFLYTIEKHPVSHSFVPSLTGVPSLEIKKYKISQTYGSDGKIISMMNESGSPNPDYIAVSGDVNGDGYLDVNDDAYGLNVIDKKPGDPSTTINPSGYFSGSRKVTDVRIHEDEMYILYSYPSGPIYSLSSQTNDVSSGALLKVKLDANDAPSRDESFGNKGALGWTYDITKSFADFKMAYNLNTYDPDNDTTYFVIKDLYGQWPSDENKGFFGPQKILALKSKKIWIADDGAIYDENKNNTRPDEVGSIVQKDRVVVIDLERESFESVYSFDGIGFSTTVKGSGF
ncbi:hypothetical protein [Treponema parvum]|uniref:hypothetical protein n=1 Tax=Treponema parvum TaxID=138851 RepID=UPI001AEBEECE|nr:hypothetical protein [Treponema parvum]QTQ15434.1 hypothetical protein HXT04_01220 [Treponema parvum]